MDEIILGRKSFWDRVYGCWMGKSIGGSLGAPWEGKKHTHALTYYDPVPNNAAPNDDLDLQLVWLKMLEDKGLNPPLDVFADYWAEHASRYPWDEYGFFMRNHVRGLRPPVAGCFENYFVDNMGSPIRSEIWACIHPADPQTAAWMAWKDSAVDHSGGEGMYGEMFWAAVQSAAFVESDPMTLINIGLGMIPLSSHAGRSVREAVWCYKNGKTWGEAREKIHALFGIGHPLNAVPNIGFIIIGWLYGKDFGDMLCKAVNCGYDTDCTGATLGALLGIMGGTKYIPEEWVKPVGEKIIMHKFSGDCGAPENINELADRVVALAEKSLEGKDGFVFGDEDAFPQNLLSRLFKNEAALKALSQDIHAGVETFGKNEVWLHYGGEPVIRPRVSKKLEVSIVPFRPVDINFSVPAGWELKREGDFGFLVRAPEEAIRGRNKITVSIDGMEKSFVILGVSEAVGYEAGKRVKICEKCCARIEECMCES